MSIECTYTLSWRLNCNSIAIFVAHPSFFSNSILRFEKLHNTFCRIQYIHLSKSRTIPGVKVQEMDCQPTSICPLLRSLHIQQSTDMKHQERPRFHMTHWLPNVGHLITLQRQDEDDRSSQSASALSFRLELIKSYTSKETGNIKSVLWWAIEQLPWLKTQFDCPNQNDQSTNRRKNLGWKHAFHMVVPYPAHIRKTTTSLWADLVTTGWSKVRYVCSFFVAVVVCFCFIDPGTPIVPSSTLIRSSASDLNEAR